MKGSLHSQQTSLVLINEQDALYSKSPSENIFYEQCGAHVGEHSKTVTNERSRNSKGTRGNNAR
jgi:hypothetical protein